jgi:uncharacterized phage-associated protein
MMVVDMLSFNTNIDKALETIVYLANKQPNIDHYHIVKTVFYADKEHLNKYGRPILGDVYKKMKAGPVPSLVLDLINFNSLSLAPEVIDKALNAFTVTQDEKRKLIAAKRETDLDEFSGSDLECIDNALDFCKDKSFSELCRISHEEKSWQDAEENGDMDYILFIDDDNPLKDGIVADLLETSSCLVF